MGYLAPKAYQYTASGYESLLLPCTAENLLNARPRAASLSPLKQNQNLGLLIEKLVIKHFSWVRKEDCERLG